MKKILFFLIILCTAGYWGFTEGHTGWNDSSLKNLVKTEQASEPLRLGKDFLGELTDWAGAFITGLAGSSDKDTPASPENNPKANEKPALSLMEKMNNIVHFQQALEARIERKNFVPSSEIPDILKKAIVATEDRRFYEHGALDPIGVVRAFITNYMAGRTVEGGSTLAQQTVKNIFLSNERTFLRKAEELALAMQLEKYYTKDQILEMYLNTIYFGHGAYGLKEASHIYFGKEPKDLDLSQCAMLAGLPQAPSAYDPIDHPKEGAERMTIVLTLMAQQGYISSDEATKAAMELWLK